MAEHREKFESSQDAYSVSLDSFEGPLDLLLYLIKKNELNIYDIPIALITEQYLGYSELMQELNLDAAGEFLVMAATIVFERITKKMIFLATEVSFLIEDSISTFFINYNNLSGLIF